MTYEGDVLANIRLVRGIEGKGFTGGVSTVCFTCDIFTAYPPHEGSEITLNGYSVPVFVIASVEYSDGAASVTAYDRCKNLDIPFDFTEYPAADEDGNGIYYDTSLIVGAIAHQCGFSSGSYSGRVPRLGYADYAGKSCREILTELSKADGGYWRTGVRDLAFSAFSPPTSGSEIPEEKRTRIVLKGAKVITRIFGEDSLYNTYRSAGEGTWEHTERISGRYITAEVTEALAAQVLSGGAYVYRGWECASAVTEMIWNIGDCIAYDNMLLPVLNAVYDLTDAGIVASLSAPAADGSFSGYKDLYVRMIEDRLPMGSLFGCTSFGRRGLEFTSAPAEGARSSETPERYGFRLSEDGVTSYDGAMLDSTMPTEIEKVSDTERRIKYGNKVFSLRYTSSGGKKTDIRFEEVT